MKLKKRILIFPLSLLLLSGCFGRHSIKIISGEDLVQSCPKYGKAGETITIETAYVTDGEIHVNLANSTPITEVSPAVFEFTMPDHDVKIRVSCVSTGGA